VSRHRTELIIVGAGPGGLAAAAHARTLGLPYVVLERGDHLADTVFCYQAGKHVMAEPGLVPRRSELPFKAGSREAVLAGWERAAADLALEVRLRQEVTRLTRGAGGSFVVGTAAGDEYEGGHVLLALGTQGNPRRLGVPGEDLPHVATRLIDPAAYSGQDVLVVGAGDSALEVALALARENQVGLVVRTPEILRAKEALEREALSAAATGQMKIYFGTTVSRIHAERTELKTPEGDLSVPARHVFLKLGATPPRKLLEAWGVAFTGEGREAMPVLSPAYESTVPGLYLVGAVSGRDLIKLAINQGYEAVEAIAGRACDPADEEVLCARLPFWEGKAAERIGQLRDEIPLFGAADELQLREVLLASRVVSFQEGETILAQNDYTDSFLAITEGAVGISIRPEGGGASRRVAVLSAGNFFGEMSLVSGRRRNATAAAVEATRLIEIPRKAMVKLLHTAPAVRRMVDEVFLIRAFRKYLFPETPEAPLWELVARATAERLDRGAVVFREGDPGDAFYLIRSGMVKIAKLSGTREIVVSYLVAGNSFGETALLDGARRTATVSAIFPTELVRLGKDVCDEFLARHPEARADLVARLEPRRIENLVLDATPRAGEVLHDLIEAEVVMGTDALIIDNYKCVRCGNCIAACEGVHDDGQARLSLSGIQIYNILAPNSCWQCADPLCMLDCPPDAIVRNARGEVYIKSNCIGCGNCERNCPYDNIFMVHPRPRAGPFGWLARLLGRGAAAVEREVAVKCDLCSGLAGGPACVRSCPTGAALRVDPRTYQRTIEEIVVRRGGG
jgi:CRP-like cAMP-binding protein/thioredoxin reductase/Fe-S-cluster-containing hydrogenase component 2